jgi:hypothetical protein
LLRNHGSERLVGSDIRPDDVRPAQIGLGDECGHELAHRSRREEIITGLGRAEARQVDRDETRLVGKR